MKKTTFKLLSAALILLAIFTILAACSGDDNVSNGPPTNDKPPVTDNNQNSEPHKHEYTTSNTCDTCGETLKVTEGLEYTYLETYDRYRVTGIGTATDSDIYFPAIYNGKKVTEIGREAFKDCDSITSVHFSSTIYTIDFDAFQNCTSLTSVNIPRSIGDMHYNPFNGCSNLSTLTAEEGGSYSSSGNCIISKRDKEVVIGCKTSVIPDDGSVTAIGAEAFEGCHGLTEINIPACITEIGYCAFYNCTSLKEITIPAGVTKIYDAFVFAGCYSLDGITVAEGNSAYHSNGNCLIETATKTLKVGSNKSVIPTDGSVTSIAKDAFNGRRGLKSIVIPEVITSIEGNAFGDCEGLESITIPFLGIGMDATDNPAFGSIFSDRPDSLKEVIITGGTRIGDQAFADWENIVSVTIPASVTSIGKRAFEDCFSLTYVKFEEGSKCTSIGDNAFINCRDLVSITIPQSVTSIGQGAFFYCYKLLEVYNLSPHFSVSAGSDENGRLGYYTVHVATDINEPSLIHETEDGFVYYGYENGSRYYLLGYTGNGTDLVFPASINDTYYEIYKYAFFEDTELTSVNFEDNSMCVEIGTCAFKDCHNLLSVTLPASLQTIDVEAFQNCYKLVEIYNLSQSIKTIVPANSSHGFISYYAFDVYTSADDASKLHTTEDGYVFYENGDTVYLVGYVGEGTKLILPEKYNGKVYSIYNYAFAYNDNIEKANIPEGITTIGDRAFYECDSLENVSIPSSIMNLGDSVFSACYSLRYNEYDKGEYLGNSDNKYLILSGTTEYGVTSIKIHESTKIITGINVNEMTELTIPASVVVIGNSAFSNYSASISKLSRVTFAENSQCISIGKYAFSSCFALESINLPSSLKTIGERAFSSCFALESINLPSSVTSIGANAFSSCSALESINLPSSVTSIGANAFSNCYVLTSITFADTEGWYTSSNTEGEEDAPIDVSDSAINATTFRERDYAYALYKNDEQA